MSRILRLRRVIFWFTVTIMMGTLVYSFLMHIEWLLITITIGIIILSSSVLNFFTIKKIEEQMLVFSSKSKKRNVDYLIIGENCDPHQFLSQKTNSYVQILDPTYSLQGIFQVLRRTFSILAENGTVILVMKMKGTDKKEVSLMDIFFLHEITIKMLGLEKKQKCKKFIFYLHPIKSIKIIFGIKSKTRKENCEIQSEIANFCRERKLKIKFFYV